MKANNEIRVALMYGGISHEHEISLLSGERVYRELIKKEFSVTPIFIAKSGKWYIQDNEENSPLCVGEDPENLLFLLPSGGIYHKGVHLQLDVAIPITHGKGGEDGILQGLLEIIHMPYIGPSPHSSMMGMHKRVAKLIAQEASIPVVPHISLSLYDSTQLTSHCSISKNIAHIVGYSEYKMSTLSDLFSVITSRLGSSLIIKAEDEGSSVGVEVFREESEESFYEKLMKVFTYSSLVLVESYISNMVEIECGVFKGDHIIASNPKVIANPKTENPHFLSYTQKYFSAFPFSIDSSFPLSHSISSLIKEHATRMSELLLIEGFARCDFFYQKETQSIFFNEINTIPGLTNTSIYPLLMEEIGYPLGDLLTLLIYQKLGEE